MVLGEALKTFFRRPPWGIVWVLVALMLGSGLTVALQFWASSAKPHIVKVNSIRIEDGDHTRGRWLNVQLTAPATSGCLRISQHLLYQDPAPGNRRVMRHYVPLGSALNGMSFSAVVADFNVLLELPAGLSPGEWWYVDRSAYFCEIWPFHRIIQSQTEPVMVRIDG